MSSTVGELSEGNSRTIDHMFICGTNCQKMPLRLNNPENKTKQKQKQTKKDVRKRGGTTAQIISSGNAGCITLQRK